MIVVEQIKRRLTILEAAERYAGVSPKLKGNTYWCSCLKHNERTPSMQIFHDKDKYRCFSCHSYGDQIDLVAEAMNISNQDAIKLLLKDLGLDAEISEDERQDIERSRAKREQERACREQQEAEIKAEYIRLVDIERLFYRFINSIKEPDDLDRYEVVISLKSKDMLEYWIEGLLNGSQEDKLEVVKVSKGWNPWKED